LYAYAANNPVRYIDPDGKSAKAIVLGWISTDTVVLEPSDAVIWKWVGYGLAFAGACTFDYFAKKAAFEAISNVASQGKKSGSSESAAMPKNGAVSAAGSPAPNGNNNNDNDYYESSSKHNPNSKSPEPKNAKEMFEKSVKDDKGRRWYKDKSGTLHRFEGSNHKYHWNGSYEGKASQMDGNVQKWYRSLPKGEIDACW
jgi:hypothetical protein